MVSMKTTRDTLIEYICNDIIPNKTFFVKDNKLFNHVVYGSKLDYKSICVWLSTGFFWETLHFSKI